MTRPVVTCDIGLNHQADLSIAKSLISLAAEYGADFVKFQKRCDLDAIYTQEYLDTPVTDERLLKWGKTIREQREFLEFGKEEYDEIDAHCKKMGIGWYASVWDVKAVEFMRQYDPPFIKIPSVGVTNSALGYAAGKSGIPVIVSTGMSTESEIMQMYRWIAWTGGRCAHLLHCVAVYPAENSAMNMRRMVKLKEAFGPGHAELPIGFSNHCTDIIHIIQAAVMGASMVEFHITLDRNMDGPDHRASIGPMGFKRIMDHLANIAKSWGDGNLEPSEEELAKGRHYLWRQ